MSKLSKTKAKVVLIFILQQFQLLLTSIFLGAICFGGVFLPVAVVLHYTESTVSDFVYTYLWQFYVTATAVNAVFLYLYIMIKATKSANEKIKKAKEAVSEVKEN